jgi:hypothetical protein
MRGPVQAVDSSSFVIQRNGFSGKSITGNVAGAANSEQLGVLSIDSLKSGCGNRNSSKMSFDKLPNTFDIRPVSFQASFQFAFPVGYN